MDSLKMREVDQAIESCKRQMKVIKGCIDLIATLDSRSEVEWVVNYIHKVWHDVKNKKE